MVTAVATNTPANGLARYVPAIGWLRQYQAGWLRSDLIAVRLLPLTCCRPGSDMPRLPDSLQRQEWTPACSQVRSFGFFAVRVKQPLPSPLQSRYLSAHLWLDLPEATYHAFDLHGAPALGELADELVAAGIRMRVVEAHSAVRDRLRAEGIGEKFGGVDRSETVAHVVEDFERETAIGTRHFG